MLWAQVRTARPHLGSADAVDAVGVAGVAEGVAAGAAEGVAEGAVAQVAQQQLRLRLTPEQRRTAVLRRAAVPWPTRRQATRQMVRRMTRRRMLARRWQGCSGSRGGSREA